MAALWKEVRPLPGRHRGERESTHYRQREESGMFYFSQQLQLPLRRSRGPVSPWESGFGLPAAKEWRGSVVSKMELRGENKYK